MRDTIRYLLGLLSICYSISFRLKNLYAPWRRHVIFSIFRERRWLFWLLFFCVLWLRPVIKDMYPLFYLYNVRYIFFCYYRTDQRWCDEKLDRSKKYVTWVIISENRGLCLHVPCPRLLRKYEVPHIICGRWMVNFTLKTNIWICSNKICVFTFSPLNKPKIFFFQHNFSL